MSQTKRQTSKDYLVKYQEQARKGFEKHVIRSRDSRSWLCFQPYTDEKGGWNSHLWFEAIVLAGGELYVHGDISSVHFAHYGKHERPEQVLYWMGGTNDLGYYVLQKARIGMNLPNSAEGVLEVLDEGVWLDRALDHIETDILDKKGAFDGVTEIDLEPYRDQIDEWLFELVNRVLEGDDEIEKVVADSACTSEAYEAGALEWGRVPSTRLIYAHEALKKLCQLLDAERAAKAEQKQEAVGDGG